MSVTIYHNPACGTSRNTLAMIRQSGEEPEVIEYLKTSAEPGAADRTDRRRWASRFAHCCAKRARPMRNSGSPIPNGATTQLIDFMLAHPILINRPIVVTPKGVELCRPSEAVLDLLDHPVALAS